MVAELVGQARPNANMFGYDEELRSDPCPSTLMPSAPRASRSRRSWTSKDCLLYALGVGAGAADPLDELAFTTENTTDVAQRVLPTMAVVLGVGAAGVMGAIGAFNPAMLVHGEQAHHAAPRDPRRGRASRPSARSPASTTRARARSS